MKNRNTWYVYIIKCKDDRLYTGITNDLERRIKQHNRGKGCRFTKFRTPVELLYKEVYPSRSVALKREAAIKGWSRDRKLELFSVSAVSPSPAYGGAQDRQNFCR